MPLCCGHTYLRSRRVSCEQAAGLTEVLWLLAAPSKKDIRQVL